MAIRTGSTEKISREKQVELWGAMLGLPIFGDPPGQRLSVGRLSFMDPLPECVLQVPHAMVGRIWRYWREPEGWADWKEHEQRGYRREPGNWPEVPRLYTWQGAGALFNALTGTEAAKRHRLHRVVMESFPNEYECDDCHREKPLVVIEYGFERVHRHGDTIPEALMRAAMVPHGITED